MTEELSREDIVAPYRRSGTLSGKCLCGAVHVEIAGDYIAAVGVCHCAMCQRWNGAMSGGFVATAAAVSITGDVTVYASSPFAERAFCTSCGSHIWLRDTNPEEREIELLPGLFDAARDFPVISEIYVDRAPQYAVLAGDHIRKTRADYEVRNQFVEGDDP